MKRSILVSSIFLTIGLYSKAVFPTCSPSSNVDNRALAFYDSTTSSHIMRDQGPSEWCYSYVTADLVTHYLARTNPQVLSLNNGGNILRRQQLISPISVFSNLRNIRELYSTIDHDESFARSFDLGTVNDFWRRIYQNPNNRVCLENEVRSTSEYNDKFSDQLSIYSGLNQLEEIYNSQTPNDSIEVFCSSWSNLFSTVLPGLTFNEFSEIITESYMASDDGLNMVANLIEHSCQNPVSIGKLPEMQRVRKSLSDGRDNSDQMIATIDEQLESGNILGLRYNAYFLQNTSPELDAKGNQINSPHYSSIVGSRCSDGVKQYLIRNSYGSSCESYAQELDCEEGNIWVSQELLLQMSLTVSYL